MNFTTDSDSENQSDLNERQLVKILLSRPEQSITIAELALVFRDVHPETLHRVVSRISDREGSKVYYDPLKRAVALKEARVSWKKVDTFPSRSNRHRRQGKRERKDKEEHEERPPGHVGYLCVGEEINLGKLEGYYRSRGYKTKIDYDVLHVRSLTAVDTSAEGLVVNHPSGPGPLPGSPYLSPPISATIPSSIPYSHFELFVFQYGAIVWWGVDLKHCIATEFIHENHEVSKFVVKRYHTKVIKENYPVWCDFSLVEQEEGLTVDDRFVQQLKYDHFVLPVKPGDFTTAAVPMLCISHALAQSAKIDFLEVKVATLTQACRPLPTELKEQGKVTIQERSLLQLRGEVLSYRLMLKSGSDLLDEPELFWQNPFLKPFFEVTRNAFQITERAQALDSKLDANNEILSMVGDQFNQMHGARLEWIVIWLVLVEVIIGVLELVVDLKPWVT
jgi:uncharacterized Rmd1/YagE family protein